MEVFDISSAIVQIVMGVVLVSIKVPDDRNWGAIRRMNILLFACYVCIGISNLVTGTLSVGEQGGPVMWLAMILVSMYQALLFTSTCVTFISPHRASVRWLSVNAAIITLVTVISISAFCLNEGYARWIQLADTVLYSMQLVYYCHLFWKTYDESRRRLEASYDEDMSVSLRWITRCFIGALTVGVCALLFAVFRLGATEYVVFTCLSTLYYIYLVICVINYRISAGFIVKVVAAEDPVETEAEENVPAEGMESEEEKRLASAIKKWVEEKRYVQNDQTVEEIATELETSHAMLKWYFTNRMHTTFRSWRLEMRVAEAKRLLRDEGVSTAIVHKLVGVADKSNFYKLFRKQVGMTPTEFKESVQNKNSEY